MNAECPARRLVLVDVGIGSEVSVSIGFSESLNVRALYVVFPISWFVTAATLFTTFFICYKREKKMLVNELK